jgi:cell division protein FtsA
MDVVRNPIHATGVGLLLYGFENIVRRNQRSTPVTGSVADLWGQMRSWFQGQF